MGAHLESHSAGAMCMRNGKWHTRPVLLVVGVLCLGTAVWIWQHQRPSSTEHLTLADASQPVFALVYIAEAEGYFAAQGLQVTYKSFTSGRDALSSVVHGHADLATVYETPVVLRASQGEALSVLTTLHTSTRNTALVARTDHGITTPDSLRGKTVAVSKNTNGEFFLHLYLTSQSIPLADVTFVDLKPEEMVPALKEGVVDAIAIWNPHVYNAQQAFQPGQTTTFYSDVYTEMSLLVGQRHFVAQRKEALHRFLTALVRAEQFLHQHEEAAKRIVVERLAHYPEATIRGVWAAFTAELKLNNVLLAILKEEATWFKHQGKVTGPIPNFGPIIFPDYLQRIKPEVVTVLAMP